ncbi:MAG: FAD-dependent oxidoreductase, partial [Candidatus Methylomirabilis sp.]
VYLGGGVAGAAELGTFYKKGVPFSQLAELLEQIIKEFHIHRQSGESFSAFWRRRLTLHKPEVVAPEEPPTWRCRECGYLHHAENSPGFCPRCAAVNARFVRDDGAADDEAPPSQKTWICNACSYEHQGDEAPDVCPVCGASKEDFRLASQPSQLGAEPSEKVWRCGPCGYEHFGEEAPDVCPVCGAPKEDFKLVSGAAAKPRTPRASPSGRRILIIGGSIGGHTAAHVCRELDPDCRITLVTDERHRFYNRLNLTRYLSDEVTREQLFDFGDQWYADQAIEVLTESRAISIDPVAKRVVHANGIECAYDALILAHGSSASVPPFYRDDLTGAFLLRTLDDTDAILTACQPGIRAAVIGGGVLGLEAAYGLVKHGATVSVFEYFPYLMPRQLDAEAAALFAELVKEKGITPYMGVEVRDLLGRDRAEGLTLADGRRFEADLVVVSTGITPNTDWIRRAGIDCKRGIVVDDRMQTSAENVYAAGDVAEWRGQVVGLWSNAIEQAKVAAANAVGKPFEFSGFVPVMILKCLGIPLFSIGEVLSDGEGTTAQIVNDSARRIYRKLVTRHGLPVGGILLNTTEGMAEMKKVVEATAQINRLTKMAIGEPVASGR